MFDSPEMILAIVGGGLVAWVVQLFLFRIGCILADVPECSWGNTLLLVTPVFLVFAPLAFYLVLLLMDVAQSKEVPLNLLLIPGLLAYMLVTWAVITVIYKLVLKASYRTGMIVAGVELLLTGLASALVTAVVLVVLAAVQYSERRADLGTWDAGHGTRGEQSALLAPPADNRPT
jgi:hypothetical protein